MFIPSPPVWRIFSRCSACRPSIHWGSQARRSSHCCPVDCHHILFAETHRPACKTWCCKHGALLKKMSVWKYTYPLILVRHPFWTQLWHFPMETDAGILTLNMKQRAALLCSKAHLLIIFTDEPSHHTPPLLYLHQMMSTQRSVRHFSLSILWK